MTPEMTYAAMSWLRYQKNADVVCTEVGTHFFKDVFGIWIGQDGLPTSSVEIEIKTSISDLRRDFSTKAKKHEWYEQGRNCPNYFYYVVPKTISGKAGDFLRGKSLKYGLMEFDAETFLDQSGHPLHVGNVLTSIIRCKRLTDARPAPSLLQRIGRRIMNEYFMQKYQILQLSQARLGDIEFYAKAVADRDRGKIDKYSPLEGEKCDE